MKTKEELASIKEEVINLSRRLAELTEDELSEVSGGQGLTAIMPYIAAGSPNKAFPSPRVDDKIGGTKEFDMMVID